VRFWRRREPLHEKLLREAGILPGAGGPLDPRSPLEVGIHGLQRHREWDAVVTVETSLEAESVEFTVLPDGTLLVEDELPDEELAPLAEAVERELQPPYRAQAVRRDDELWAVAAQRIEVVEVPEEVGGDEIELAVQDDHRTLLVDGEKVFGSVPTLEALARERYESFVVRAERLDGVLWEVKVAAL
jgi:hypothetical protein